MKTFGEFARYQLKLLEKSQKELAKGLGVSPAYISQILTGRKNPPDLGRYRNRKQLRFWAEFLEVAEEELLDYVRFELHGVSPRPSPRFRNMRRLLLGRLSDRDSALEEDIRALELHPAENMIILELVQLFFILQDIQEAEGAYTRVRFREVCFRQRGNKEFVEGVLVSFFGGHPFFWEWDSEAALVRIHTDSDEILDAMGRINRLLGKGRGSDPRAGKVPLVGHVSAGDGFEFTDGGYPVGEGFDHVDLPPGVSPSLAERLYCVRIRGDSLKEFISEGAVLFIKPESWEEIRDGDLVIFKDRREMKAFVKKVEFSGDSLILKSMNPMYGNKVIAKTDLCLLERVMSIVF